MRVQALEAAAKSRQRRRWSERKRGNGNCPLGWEIVSQTRSAKMPSQREKVPIQIKKGK